jgi:hypothetical protein
MRDKENAHRGRKTYGKPEVRRIELRPEESLAAGCKTLSSAETGQPAGTPCTVSSCFDIGS